MLFSRMTSTLVIMMLLLSITFVFYPSFKIENVRGAYTDLYVNATSGVDAPGGGGPHNAFATIDYAYESIGAVYNPIRLWIMAGTYDERVYRYADRYGSGNATHPAIISAYFNSTTSTYDDVIWKWSGGGDNEGAFTATQLHHFIVEHITFMNGSCFLVFLSEQTDTYPIHNGTIRYCTFINSSGSGIRVNGGSGHRIDNISVYNNTLIDMCNCWNLNSQEGVSFSASHHCYIYNNIILNCHKNSIDLKSSTSYIDVYDNRINTTHGWTPIVAQPWQIGGGIYIDSHGGWSHHHRIFNNTIWGNYSKIHIGSEDADTRGSCPNNHSVFNNVVVVNETPTITIAPFYFEANNDGGAAQNYVDNITVYYNTLVNGYASFLLDTDTVNPINCEFKDNICYNYTNFGIYTYGNGIEDVDVDYNQYNGGSSEHWGGHAINGTHSFVNEGEGNYRLEQDSSAIGNAVDVGIYYDFDGNVRPQDGNYDIGAFEFISESDIYFISIDGGVNGTSVLSSRPTFNWSIVSNTSHYWLQVSNVSTFATTVINITDVCWAIYSLYYTQNATRISFTLPVGYELPSMGTFYCRVRAYVKG